MKIKRAQKVLRAGTETETVDHALDLVIAEIKDAYGKLAE